MQALLRSVGIDLEAEPDRGKSRIKPRPMYDVRCDVDPHGLLTAESRALLRSLLVLLR